MNEQSPDADTPRVPEFRWAPVPQWGGAVYIQSPRGNWYRLDVTADPVDVPADAVKLGDVEALRKLLHRAAPLIREAAEGLQSANAPADLERAWLADWNALRLDREPGREEPTPTAAEYFAALSDLVKRANRALEMGNFDRQVQRLMPLPPLPEPASAPRTLLGWTVPEHVIVRALPSGAGSAASCLHNEHAIPRSCVITDPEATDDSFAQRWLTAHAHGHVVEHQPEEGRRG